MNESREYEIQAAILEGLVNYSEGFESGIPLTRTFGMEESFFPKPIVQSMDEPDQPISRYWPN